MRIRELRAKAREDAQGNKMALALPVFAMTAIVYLIGVIPNFLQEGIGKAIVSLIASLATLFFSVGASYALIIRTLHVARKEEKTNFFADVFGEGTRNGWSCAWGVFKKIWYWVLLIVVGYILMILGGVFGVGGSVASSNGFAVLSILMIIGGLILVILSAIKIMIASYRYFLVTYLKHDYPERSTKELLEKSKEMMDGNKAKAFVIPLTFIGWLLLAGVCGGIVSIIFNLIWQPVVYFGVSVSTVPLWAEIIMTLIIYFISSFVSAYMQMTYCEFYLERNPLEIYNEDYVKPETNEQYYKKIIGWVVGIIVVVYVAIIALGGFLFNQAGSMINNSTYDLNSILEQMK